MKRKLFILFLCGLCLISGCSFVQDTYDATKLTNEMQYLVDNANKLINQQMEIDKVMTDPDPNTRDKIKIQQALDLLKRGNEQVIPAFEQSVKQIKARELSFEAKTNRLENGEVKQLAKDTLKNYQEMMSEHLAYAEEARKFAAIQTQFFGILQKGKEPTDAEIDKMNVELEIYGKKTDQLNAKIDAFNEKWEKLANKSGSEM